MSLLLRFYGHACFGVELAGVSIVIDPFEPGSLGGAVRLPAPPDVFDAVVCTHEHVDHAARHVVPRATDLSGVDEYEGVHIDRQVASHDEFSGRLRGGSTTMLRLRAAGSCLVHCGDLGERPTGETLTWLRSTPIDVLIVPVGGYFTLGADGAAELAALLNPRVVVPCHSADDGVALAELSGRRPFIERYAAEQVAEIDALRVPIAAELPEVVVLRRA